MYKCILQFLNYKNIAHLHVEIRSGNLFWWGRNKNKCFKLGHKHFINCFQWQNDKPLKYNFIDQIIKINSTLGIFGYNINMSNEEDVSSQSEIDFNWESKHFVTQKSHTNEILSRESISSPEDIQSKEQTSKRNSKQLENQSETFQESNYHKRPQKSKTSSNFHSIKGRDVQSIYLQGKGAKGNINGLKYKRKPSIPNASSKISPKKNNANRFISSEKKKHSQNKNRLEIIQSQISQIDDLIDLRQTSQRQRREQQKEAEQRRRQQKEAEQRRKQQKEDEQRRRQQKEAEQRRKQQKEAEQRRRQLEVTKKLLSGKVSIIWIFIISNELNQDVVERIQKMYSGLSQQPYLVPLCKRASEAEEFLMVPNSLFKIVSDLGNIARILRKKDLNGIVEFYIYNNEGQAGFSKAIGFKSLSRKVKGIYDDLKKIIDRAEEEVQNQIQMFNARNGIQMRRIPKKFPSFIRLSGEDKTQATLYRANLYGALKISQDQKNVALLDFMTLVEEKYSSQPYESDNIQRYRKLNHTNFQLNEAREILKFYVKQSFYYKILNSMLRTMKTTQQFKPCILPFYENYHAVKILYKQDLLKNNRSIPAQTLYRGTKLKLRDFQVLKPNMFIEIFGFMSTSKSEERAKQFTNRNGYIFVIHVPELTLSQNLDKYDHGFVDINQHNLADTTMQVEQQVLFNALNIYKVRGIKQSSEGFKMIHLEYGSIFRLLSMKKSELTPDESDVLINYQYCSDLHQEIEDQGDVYLLANEHEQSKNYYRDKISTDQSDGKYYYKLANVQQICGQLLEAHQNAERSLKLQLGNLNVVDRENCLKVFSIHSKNAEISLVNEDYLHADQSISDALKLLTEQNTFEKAKKIRERGQIKFKKGEIKAAEKDLEESQKLLKSLTEQALLQKSKIKRDYLFSFLTLLCSDETQEQIEDRRNKQLRRIEERREQILAMRTQINDELIKVNNSMKEVATYTGNKDKYETCVKKGKAYLLQVQSRKTEDPLEKARLKVLEATIKDYIELVQSQKLLNEAIQLVESGEPFDPTVGKYASILGDLQKKKIQQFSVKGLKSMELTKEMEPIQYNEQQRKIVYEKCKGNYEKALNILLINNKTKQSPEVMNLKNKIGELEFNESNYSNSQKIIKEIKQARPQNQHSEVSKACLLLSKISYARGELKDAFENVEQSEQILKKAIIKDDNDNKYQIIFENNQIYRGLMIHRAKIYMNQMKHDLSLKELDSLNNILHRRNEEDIQCKSIIADICELKAQIFAINHQEDFQEYFKQSIKLREKQIGHLNWANGVAYCNQAKYMIYFEQLQQAAELLKKASQIFGRFAENHPLTWQVLFCNGIYNEKKDNIPESIANLQKCIELAGKNFGQQHISINKIKYHFGKILQRDGQYEQAIRCFEDLQYKLEIGLSESQSRRPFNNENDDEKVTLKLMVCSSLRDSYSSSARIECQ